jgi:integrase
MNTDSFRVEVPKFGMRGTCFWRRSHWWLRFTADKKIKRASLKTTDAKIAKAKAISYLTILGEQGMAKLKATAAMRDTAPTIGAIADHYLKVTDCDTAQRNVNCLFRVIARARGWTTEGARAMTAPEKAKVMAVRSTELTDQLAVDYQRADKVATYTKGTTLAGAKAVFARTKDWVGFPLPDISGFLNASKEAKQKYNPNSFQHIPKEKLDAMERESRTDETRRRVFICCRYLGMTPKEVSFARKSWIEDRPLGKAMCVRERPDEGFSLKTGGARERDIVVAPWTAEALLKADDYLVPLPTSGLRYQYIVRVFNLWLRTHIPDRKGAAYELRKQAGSDWLEATGQISQVQHLLGHSTPTTTSRWYATWQKAVVMPPVFQEEPTI